MQKIIAETVVKFYSTFMLLNRNEARTQLLFLYETINLCKVIDRKIERD